MEIAVTGARAITPQDNETIKKAVQAHTSANWHIGDQKGQTARQPSKPKTKAIG